MRPILSTLILFLFSVPGLASPLDADLVKATYAGDADRVAALLNQGASPTNPDIPGKTCFGTDGFEPPALVIAARYEKSLPVLQRFLDVPNVDINVRSKASDCLAGAQQETRTPLLEAAQWGNDAGARLLIERGADLNVRTKSGWDSVITYALRAKKAALLAPLWDRVSRETLEHGFDYGLVWHPESPEFLSTQLHFFLERGVSIDRVFKVQGMELTLLTSALKHSPEPFATQVLDSGADPNLATSTARAIRALGENYKISPEARVRLVEKLFAKGFRARHADFMYCVFNDRLTMADAMAAHGYDVNALEEGRPLLYTLTAPNEPVIKYVDEGDLRYLHGKGYDLNAGFGGSRPLHHFAAYEGNKKLIPVLLELGASVNEKDERGNTALALLAGTLSWLGDEAHLLALLAHGADAQILNDQNESPLFALFEHMNWQKKIDFDRFLPQLLAASSRVLNELSTGRGYAPLHALIEHAFQFTDSGGFDRWAITVNTLLDAGADPNGLYVAYGNIHKTPLMQIACAVEPISDERVIRSLIAHGADRDRKDENGKTALDHAKACKNAAFLKVMASLPPA